MIVLDTDHVTFIERTGSAHADRLRVRLQNVGTETVATTIITYEELTRGWLASVAGAKNLAKLIRAYADLGSHLDVFRRVQVLQFDDRAAMTFQMLRTARVRIGTLDLRIASIALAQGATLLTRNLRDFGRVPDLRIEDWTV
jgi:tRNA(fMet)-specific endonuclease VapC